MSRHAYAFIAVVVASALGLVYLLPMDAFWSLTSTDVVGITCFFAVAVLAEALAIDFGTGRQARASLSFLPFLACTGVYPPAVAVAVVAGVIVVSNFVLRQQSLAKGLFNVAQVVLSVGLAGVVYTWIAGAAGQDSLNYLGFAALSATFFTVNIVLTSTAIAFIKELQLRVVLVQVIGPRGSNLWYDLLASPIAIVPAVMYDTAPITGILVIILPALVIRYSYLSKLQLEEANRDLLKVLVKAIETRDPYTSGHSVRVSTLAKIIATDIELSRKNIERAETAALLHDIGKIDSIYTAVIQKPYDLNSEERALIQTHATKGADLLQSLSSLSSEVIRAVRFHHERYDGAGYPSGLRGTEIPVAARIIMLCDSIDAMLSDRPYRKALSIEKVRSELARCAGTQFDPEIVRVILSRNTLERAALLVKESAPESIEILSLVNSA